MTKNVNLTFISFPQGFHRRNLMLCYENVCLPYVVKVYFMRYHEVKHFDYTFKE